MKLNIIKLTIGVSTFFSSLVYAQKNEASSATNCSGVWCPDCMYCRDCRDPKSLECCSDSCKQNDPFSKIFSAKATPTSTTKIKSSSTPISCFGIVCPDCMYCMDCGDSEVALKCCKNSCKQNDPYSLIPLIKTTTTSTKTTKTTKTIPISTTTTTKTVPTSITKMIPSSTPISCSGVVCPACMHCMDCSDDEVALKCCKNSCKQNDPFSLIPSVKTTTTSTKTTKTVPVSTTTTTKTVPTSTTKTIPSSTPISCSGVVCLGCMYCMDCSDDEVALKCCPNSCKQNDPFSLIPSVKTTTTSTKTTKTIPISTTTTTTTKTIPCSPVTITVKDISTITITETVTVRAAVSNSPDVCATKYAQCGGKDFKGPTCCQSGSTCQKYSEYYSQCI